MATRQAGFSSPLRGEGGVRGGGIMKEKKRNSKKQRNYSKKV